MTSSLIWFNADKKKSSGQQCVVFSFRENVTTHIGLEQRMRAISHKWYTRPQSILSLGQSALPHIRFTRYTNTIAVSHADSLPYRPVIKDFLYCSVLHFHMTVSFSNCLFFMYSWRHDIISVLKVFDLEFVSLMLGNNLYCVYSCKTVGVLVIYMYVLPADTMETYLYILINNIFTAFLYKYSW